MNQRRRPSPAVYRRRRLAAALLAVVLLALALWGGQSLYEALAGPDGASESTAQDQDEDQDQDESQNTTEDDDAAGSADPSEEAEEAEETEETVPEGHCAPVDIEVRASTSHDSYDASTAPLLIMEIENVGSEECTLDVGTAEQQFQIADGGGEVFNTAQCELGGDSLEMDFEPGQTERAQMLWPRSDSAVDCAEPTELSAGDYELSVSVSGISSDPHTFEITGSAG